MAPRITLAQISQHMYALAIRYNQEPVGVPDKNEASSRNLHNVRRRNLLLRPGCRRHFDVLGPSRICFSRLVRYKFARKQDCEGRGLDFFSVQGKGTHWLGQWRRAARGVCPEA